MKDTNQTSSEANLAQSRCKFLQLRDLEGFLNKSARKYVIFLNCHRIWCVGYNHRHTQFILQIRLHFFLKVQGNAQLGIFSLIGCGISHLTALSLSFSRVSHPERAEDESATGDEPSRGTHCGSLTKGRRKLGGKKEKKNNLKPREKMKRS